jgi:acyl transferase domain-containing protein
MADLSERIARLTPEQRAVLAKRLQSSPAAARAAGPEPIAIIGLGCRVPGAESPQEFWQLLTNRVDAITEVPSNRWDVDALFDPNPAAAGKVATRWGGFLRGVEQFDPYFFGISPREATRMDPQQRLLLEVAWEAFEDAGQTLDGLAGSQTGVFIGLHSHSCDYLFLQFEDPAQMDAFTGPGTAHNIASGRLSYLFDLQGPNLVVDTACSSSLVAVHLACQSLRAGECSMALAGGVNLMLSPLWNVPLSRMQILAADGRCKAFDARADGMVRSEGCGAVVLKRLSDAVADRDRILAVIRGSAINQDGRTNGITAPNGVSQRTLLRQALRNAGVRAEDISYVETHGTGTALGDPIEVEALAEVIGQPRPDGARCQLGAVKTNIGHLEGAAGIAGLIKVVLSLQHRSIPPIVHFTSLNPHITLAGSALEIPTALRPWVRDGAPRLAGVSSFGWSGTNAHVILEEAPPAAEARPEAPVRAQLLPISARSEAALRALAGRYRDLLRSGELRSVASLEDVCFTAATRRTHHDHRAAFIGATFDQLADALAAFVDGAPQRGTSIGQQLPGRAPAAVFVFCGQGPQWWGMGRELLAEEPVFRDALLQCDEQIRQLAGWSLVDELKADEGASRLNETEFAQPALFALQVALAALWKAWGVTPAAAIGHSVGEIAAAHTAGALTLEQAARIVVHRGRIMQRATGAGKMAVVELPARDVQPLIAAFGGRLSIAAINSPSSTVVSGEPAAVDELAASLRDQKISFRPIPVNYAFHSYQMEPFARELEQELAGLTPATVRIPMWSTVTGAACRGDDLDARYWARNVRQPVLFAQAIDRHDAERQVFVEIGPHPVLTTSIAQCAREGIDRRVLHSLNRSVSERGSMLAGLGGLYVAGCQVEWRTHFSDVARSVSLPSYPWQRERFWVTPSRAGALGHQLFPSQRSAEGGINSGGAYPLWRDWLYVVEWSPELRPQAEAASAASLSGSWLILADEGGVGARLAARIETAGGKVMLLHADRSRAGHGTSLAIDPDDPADYARAWSAIAAAGTVRGVVHLWSLDSTSAVPTLSSLASDQRRNCGSLLHLIRAIVSTSALPPLWFVSKGAQAVDANPAVVNVAQAPAWGLLRSLERELIDFRCVRIDLDPNPADDVEAMVGELSAGEGEVAFRQGTRYVARLQRASAGQPQAESQTAPSVLRSDAAYLITGGLGALGLQVARSMAAAGARHLVLVGRRPPGDAALAALEQLKGSGANVVALQADIGRREDVERLLAHLSSSLPPLRGIVHAAGVLDDGVLIQQQWPRFERVMAPKIAGSWNLHELTSTLPLDFFVLFSSASAVLGSAGQTNYAAANGFMDALAHYRRAHGMPAVSLNWGAWSLSGMAAALDQRDQNRWSEQGMRTIGAEAALGAFHGLIASARAQLAVVDMDWERYGAQSGHRRGAFFASLSGGSTRESAKAPAAVKRLRDDIEAAPPRARRNLLRDRVREHALKVLGLPAAFALEDRQGLRAVGLDSLLALELRNRLQADADCSLPATFAFDFPTVADMTRYLGDDVLSLGSAEAGTAAETPATDAALDELDQMSDEMAEALLNAELSGSRANAVKQG